MKIYSKLLIIVLALLTGCSFMGPEEKAIKQMVETFVQALSREDDDLAEACLLDLRSFKILNPDVSARVDAESFTASILAELIHTYRDLKGRYGGKTLKVKDFTLGTPFYHYKGHSAFKDNEVKLSVDGQIETLYIGAIVRVGDRWLIVDLTGRDY